MYMEDVDLCWRLRRLGWRVGYDPAGAAVHVQGASTEGHPYRMILEHHRSAYRFASRRWQGLQRGLLPPTALFLAIRAVLDMAARGLRTRPELPKVSR
jgi:N-acetylglucosaminyl-diphospho-decaprenol L-rhamnosyltransferase